MIPSIDWHAMRDRWSFRGPCASDSFSLSCLLPPLATVHYTTTIIDSSFPSLSMYPFTLYPFSLPFLSFCHVGYMMPPQSRFDQHLHLTRCGEQCRCQVRPPSRRPDSFRKLHLISFRRRRRRKRRNSIITCCVSFYLHFNHQLADHL